MASFTLGAGADSSGVKLGAGGRDVLNPFTNRGEVGSFGLYEANWGGARKSRQLQEQLEKDLIADSPFQVITAQEVDKAFAAKLADSNVGGGWMVVTGDEESKTLLIGARASLAKEVKLLEWHRLVDGEYRAKNNKKETSKATAYSRMMLAQVVWKQPMANQESHTFLTCHMHCQTAKKSTGFAFGNTTFWHTLKAIIQRHHVDFITGDFNMSLWEVCTQLRINHPVITMLAWYGWKTVAGGSYKSVQQADGEDCDEDVVGATAPVVPGKARPVGLTPMHRSDSCGIFSLRKPAMVTRAMPDDAFENPDAELEEWMQGQGYPIESFLGERLR